MASVKSKVQTAKLERNMSAMNWHISNKTASACNFFAKEIKRCFFFAKNFLLLPQKGKSLVRRTSIVQFSHVMKVLQEKNLEKRNVASLHQLNDVLC